MVTTPLTPSMIRDVQRAVVAHRYELDGGDLVLPGDANFRIGGEFHTRILRHDAVARAIDLDDPELEQTLRASSLLQPTDAGYYVLEESRDHNLIPDAGINYILDVVFGVLAKVTAWYHAPFKSNWTPGTGTLSNWAGLSSGPNATELTEYVETGRQLAVFANPAASKKITSSTGTRFTLATGASNISLYGSTLNSNNTQNYNATDGKVVAASRFTTTKTGLGASDKIDIEYEISAMST